ncbi:Uma2 family endonuclease [Streptomyces liangshanensis]|uniref:Uma2 family endonuclease n=1 Tax=Streptomyces liangshanensis TaxID=2717324 RepID=A0A6G9H103_9ACTN|nr:Uma2 family endonuclease [Streptomyces liangshanensis]QIQ04222.1 Uma2 family endonuclease [Streptomyces liangshanensis]
MTVVETDRIDMAHESAELTLDTLFERLEQMPVPEGYKVEIVGGNIHMSPQRDTHWEIILDLIEQLRTRYPRTQVKSDVRIDFPGHLNGFAPDVAKLADGAKKDARGRWSHEDLEFIAEVISQGTAPNDYGPKKAAYAAADIPVYLIADPYTGLCRVFTEPKDGEYASELTVRFGHEVDLTGTVVDLRLRTAEFPRD